jgi:hypothetical protein
MDSPTHKVSLDYSPGFLDKEGVNNSKKYSFWPNAESMHASTSWPRLVEGLLVNNANDEEYFDAIASVIEARFDALEECDYATASPLAVRTLTNKTTSQASKQIYVSLSAFHKMEKLEETDKFVRGPRGKTLTEEQYTDMVRGGCIQCGANVTLLDQDHIQWVNGGVDPLCASCVEEVKAQSKEVRKS